ncbi:NitT/TauT family transport system substrate-binding protein [Motilibacter peucedani]|uniref:NitT/TauT family transport system substrate-binding protein n=1 Tax=Motilibacter peucedani TaxID=598650 RepID=A0A420XPT8_9ACTN|nr:ABC transporter substrate-binding protein [Motilibacter peucedani]RKS75301.1 NitT/TauT family transport system substrate-binding protein [Motilibacter peucedani]
MRSHAPLRRLSLLTAASTALALTAACGSSDSSSSAASGTSPAGSGGGKLTLGIGYFQGAALGPESIISANPELAAKVPATFKLTPMGSGVAGLAELRGGAFPVASGVGNPPVVGAIATGTPIKVIYAESFDAAQLVVPTSIKADADLAGKTIGDLNGSSEDFELRGWISTKGLTDKVKVVGFPSEAAAGAAYKAGKIDAAYVELPQAYDILKKGGARTVVTAQQIAELGFPSLNVLVVTEDFASKHADVVQSLVCQAMKGLTAVKGANAETVITNGAKLVGAAPADAIAATKALPFVSNETQLSWFKDDGGDVSTGKILKAYKLSADFLKAQGRVQKIPTDAEIASHIDPSFVEKAVADGCDK